MVLIATGATPRVLADAEPDGERILTWRQLYDLAELPEHLVVVGSGVTGAEFASAYVEMGARVTLVSSRDRVLPGEDADAAAVLQEVFAERGVRDPGPGPGRLGAPRRRRRAGHAGRRPHGDRLARADDRRLGAQHRRPRPGADRRRDRPRRVHPGRPGVPDLGARRLRGRRLHRRADAGLGRRDAGPDRDVARARRGGGADQAEDGGRGRVHPPGDRHGRASASGPSTPARCRPARSCCRCPPTRGPRCRACAAGSSSCSAGRRPAW